MFLQPAVSVVQRSPAWLVVRHQEGSAGPRTAGPVGLEEQLVVVNPVDFLRLGDVVRTLANLHTQWLGGTTTVRTARWKLLSDLYLILVDLEVLGEVLVLPCFVHLGLQLVPGRPGGGGGGAGCAGVVRVVLDVLLRLDSLILHLQRKHH